MPAHMTMPGLNITTWNLQKCVGLDLRRNPARSLNVLDDTGADLAVLQEADKRLPPRPAALPVELIHAKGWQVLPFGPMDVEEVGSRHSGPSLGWHGNAMLIRPKAGLILRDLDRLDLPGLEPRGAIRADFDTPIGPLRVIGVHLGLIGRYRRMQLAAIRRALAEEHASPTVLAGDFNEWGSGRDLENEIEPMRFLPPCPSFPSLRPLAPLDRFAVTPDLIADAPPRAHQKRPAHIASDHLPVTVRLRRANPA